LATVTGPAYLVLALIWSTLCCSCVGAGAAWFGVARLQRRGRRDEQQVVWRRP